MKKHELLEKAMRDYPAGTEYHSVLRPKQKHVSTGIFFIDGCDCVAETPTGYCIYDKEKNVWAKIIAPSILSGKCAIHVNNEREFKLLMEHYETKGWKSWLRKKGSEEPEYLKYRNFIDYHDNYELADELTQREEGYNIIPFADFAAEVGIKVPVFVLKSEDGVELFEGDEATCVHLRDDMWKNVGTYIIGDDTLDFEKSYTDLAKAFSTKEVAEAWIMEQNKPKSTSVKLFHGGTANVYADHLMLMGGVKLTPSDLEDLSQAYKSLIEVKP